MAIWAITTKLWAAGQQALKLNPAAGQNYSNLVIDYLHVNRWTKPALWPTKRRATILILTFFTPTSTSLSS
jgi:hypothetical protein